MYPNEINIMSLMGQLERGHTAKLSDHRVDKINELAGDIVKFAEDTDPYDFADSCEGDTREESIEIFTRDTVKMLENEPANLIDCITDMAGDLEIFYEQRDSLIARINSLV